MSENNSKYILNLVEDLTDSLKSYFEKNSLELITRDQTSNYENIDYILVETAEEVKVASKDFSADKNEIAIVCLGSIKEMREFLLFNGRLTIDPVFAENALGEQILNKFFNKNYNIHLDESFSDLFDEPSEFKVTNHLSAGIYIDELCVNAFENGFNIVALRSFMDHSITYFTYLKQAGLAGVPYEVEYTNNDSFFVVNIYLPVRNFVAEYMIDSFGSVNSKDPIQYLLGVVARSTEFLEVTYVENPGRLVLTAAWSKNEKKKIGGLAFNNIQTTSQTMSQLDKKVKQYKEVEVEIQEVEQKEELLQPKALPGGILEMVVIKDENSILNKEPEKASNIVGFAVAIFAEKFPDKSLNDIDEEEFNQIIGDYDEQDVVQQLSDDDKEHLLEKIQKNNITEAYDEELERVRDGLEEEDDFKQELQSTMTEEVSKRVAGHLDAVALNKILGSKDKEDLQTKISGGEEKPDDFMTKISGMDKKKEGPFAQMISSSFEKKASEFNVNISNSNDPNEKKGMMRNMISSTVDDINSFDTNMMSSSVKNFAAKNVPKNIELGMEEYAKKIGKVFENLSMEEIDDFQKNELPAIIENTLSDEDQIEDFRAELEKKSPEPQTASLGGMDAEFEDKFKEKLEEKLASLDFVDKVDDKFVITSNQIDDDQMQQIIQSTMKETMDEEFKLEKASKAEIEIQEKKIIENLSATLNVDKEEMSQIVKGGTQVAKEKELQTVVDNLFQNQPGEKEEKVVIGDKKFGKDDKAVVKVAMNPQENKTSNLAETELIKKLKKTELDKKKLENNVKMLEIKLKSQSETQSKINEIDSKSKTELEKQTKEDKGVSILPEASGFNQKAEEVIKDLKAGKEVNDNGKEALEALLNREKDILAKAKIIETDLKKSQLEVKQKELLFRSEIELANRTTKGKDLVIEKIKESMKSLIAKKDTEVGGLVNQLEVLNQRLNNDVSTKLVTQVKSLQGDNEKLAKSAEMFKNRLETLSNSKKIQDGADNSNQLSDENRALKTAKNQLENKMVIATKEAKSFESRYNKSKELETMFRTESSQYKAYVVDLESKVRALKDNEAKLSAIASKVQAQGVKNDSDKELGALKSKNTQLNAKLMEMMEKLKAGGPSGGAGANQSPKEKHLEKEKKSLQAQVSKSRVELDTNKKDLIKMKGAQTKLMNEVTKLKKDLEKATAASKGKGTSKKAA